VQDYDTLEPRKGHWKKWLLVSLLVLVLLGVLVFLISNMWEKKQMKNGVLVSLSTCRGEMSFD